MQRTAAVAVWLVTRAAVLWLLHGRDAWVTGDVGYYAESLGHLHERGIGGTLVEYPLLGVLLVAVPWLLATAVGHAAAYPETLMLLALVTDGVYAVLLHRLSGRHRAAAVWAWVLGVPLLGATAYARFDLVPGVLSGLAVLLLVRRPGVAAASVAVAAGAKLWPALVVPGLAAPTRTRRRVVLVAAVTAVVLAVAGLVAGGWHRLVSPLVWQSQRGLQIESVAAVPAMVGWVVDPAAWRVGYAASHAYEVTGPGVPLLLAGTRAATLAVAAAMLATWMRAWRHGRTVGVEAAVWTSLAAVAGFVVSSRVLSPQYLLWLLPLAAAGLGAVRGRGHRRLARWTGWLLVATALTQMEFPLLYAGLTAHRPWSAWPVLVLAARNVVLVGLFVGALRAAWAVAGEGESARHAAGAPPARA
jgi:hypothetical protein